MAIGDEGAFFEGNLNKTASTGISGVASSYGMGLFSSALDAFNQYDQAKHSARMAEINWTHNRNIVRINMGVNQFITNKNKAAVLTASTDKALQIATEEMEAKAQLTVMNAATGREGGSAQAVIHDISRKAEQAQSQREQQLEEGLFDVKLAQFKADSAGETAIGIRPINAVSAPLAIAGFAGSALSKTGSLFTQLEEG